MNPLEERSLSPRPNTIWNCYDRLTGISLKQLIILWFKHYDKYWQIHAYICGHISNPNRTPKELYGTFRFLYLFLLLFIYSTFIHRWWEKENDTSYIQIENCCIWRVVVVRRDLTLLLLLLFLYLCSQIYICISIILLKSYSNTTKSRRYTTKQIQLIHANGNSNILPYQSHTAHTFLWLC